MPSQDMQSKLLLIAGTQVLAAVFLFIVALLFKLFPPKRINSVYGYRTASSTRDQQTWAEANRYSANVLLGSSGTNLLVTLLAAVFLRGIWVHVVGITSLLVSVAVVVVATERHLTNRVDL